MRSVNNGVMGLHNFYPLVLAPAFPEIAVAYLVESYEFLI